MTLPKLSSLTPEQIRVMIAEVCGFTRIYGCQSIITEVWVIAGGNRSNLHDCRTLETLPDYCGDLNAMAEAEKVLMGGEGKAVYGRLLAELVLDFEIDGDIVSLNFWALQRVACATATQRAHAFLLATGKAQP